MIQIRTNMVALNSRNVNTGVMDKLNRIRLGDNPIDKAIKTMGMSACQGLCITYSLHSKAFCK